MVEHTDLLLLEELQELLKNWDTSVSKHLPKVIYILGSINDAKNTTCRDCDGSGEIYYYEIDAEDECYNCGGIGDVNIECKVEQLCVYDLERLSYEYFLICDEFIADIEKYMQKELNK